MKRVLFIIGCVLFFWCLLIFVVGIYYNLSDGSFARDTVVNRLNMFLYMHTVLFFVGTYLISNNAPGDK
jgi:hypothetical protein